MEENMNKTSETKVAKSSKKKILTIALATTVGLAGAGTGGYFIWKHYNGTPQQEPTVDVETIITMVNALSNTSTGKDFANIDKAIESLPEEQRKLIPSETLKQLEEQRESYKRDAVPVNAFVDAVNDLDETSSITDINGAASKEEAAKAITNRTDLVENTKKASAKLENDKNEYEIDKTQADYFKNGVEELGDTPTGVAINEWETLYEQYYSKIERSDLKPQIDETRGMLKSKKDAYVIDKETVKAFTDLANALDDTSTKNAIDAAFSQKETAYEKAQLRVDLLNEYNKALTNLNLVNEAYTSEKLKVDNFDAAFSELGDPNNVVLTQIESVRNVGNIANNTKRSDLQARVKNTFDKLEAIQHYYDVDKTKADTFINAVGTLGDTSTQADINTAKSYEDAAQAISRQDLADKVDKASEDLAAVQAAYNVELAKVNEFADAVNDLGDTSTQADINSAKQMGEAIKTQRADLLAIFTSADTKLKDIQAAYDADASVVKDFTSSAGALGDASPKDSIDAAENKKAPAQAILDKRSGDADLQTEFNTASAHLAEVQAAYNAEKAEVDTFSAMVDNLGATSTQSEIDAAKNKGEAIVTQRPDLLASITQIKTTLNEVQTAYNIDAQTVKDFTDLANALDDTSTQVDINKANSKKEATEEIEREDLQTNVATASAHLEEVQAAYNSELAKVNEFVDAVDELEDLELPTQTQIDTAKAKKDAISTQRQDLLDMVTNASTKLTAIQTAHDADKAIADSIVDSIDSLYDEEKTSISQDDINAISTSYSEANTRVQTLADNACKAKYSDKNITAKIAEIQGEFNKGEELDTSISELPEQFSPLPSPDRIKACLVIDNYDGASVIAKKVVSQEHQTKVETVRSSINLEHAAYLPLGGSGLTDITTGVDDDYGPYSEGTTNTESEIQVATFSMDLIAELKSKYEFIIFYISSDKTAEFEVQSSTKTIFNQRVEELDKFIYVRLQLLQFPDDEEVTVTFTSESGAKLKMTHIYGES